MSLPTVAIVGRPNVGKSPLFNRIVGGRTAIVSDQAGTTRDRHFARADWGGHTFWLVDTGGLVPDASNAMDKAIRHQVDQALAAADAILFVVDGQAGVHPVDRAIAERLRKVTVPVILAVNKLDNIPATFDHFAFHELGLGEPHPVSAQVGKASGDLLDIVVTALPGGEAHPTDEISVAIIGRPNAGKSSLANRLLGEERYVVSPEAGTTRDAVDSVLQYHDTTIRFIDTAGLRKRSKVVEDIEFYSTLRTQRAIAEADVCVLVVDATRGLEIQDLRIANEVWDAGAALIIAVNKWDLVSEKDTNTAERGRQALIAKAPFLEFIPFIFLSATSGQRARKVLDEIIRVGQGRHERVATAEVNRVLRELVERNQPPQRPGEEVRLLYASQIGTAPPKFAIVSNRPTMLPESYERYLVRGFREAWCFAGSPLRLKFKMKTGKRR